MEGLSKDMAKKAVIAEVPYVCEPHLGEQFLSPGLMMPGIQASSDLTKLC